eukprot:764974-Hanusia_phi.AAC.2
MFATLQRAKKAPELPLAVRECMHNMQVGSVPLSTAQNLCSTDGSTYLTPTSGEEEEEEEEEEEDCSKIV